ncbi:MAG: ferric reductase-like transmembrane domain-containing protein [Candidatus Diapherotrites archaeon]|nr:ferric reductase-like transmembrane domain-containing protein [Candidatus Diapherotrites archaeon]
MPKLFEGAIQDWKYVLSFAAGAAVFWLLQFAYQFYVIIPNQFNLSLIRSFAFSGATLISIALLLGPLARLSPKWNFVMHRRMFGVCGFALIIGHSASVMTFLFNWNIQSIGLNASPFDNPVLFGLWAYWILFAMFLTSTDWAVAKLGTKNWKRLHRLVFIAYTLAVLHFVLVNPSALNNLAGQLLLGLAVLVFALQLLAFAKTVFQKRASLIEMGVGIALILGLGALLYLGFWLK